MDFQTVENLGISTYLYFQTLVNVLIMMAVAFLVFGIFALVTNIIASNDLDGNFTSDFSYIALSQGSKQLNPTDRNKDYLLIQAWIGVGLVTIWGIMFLAFKIF